MAARKPRVTPISELAATIEKIATGKPGETVVRFDRSKTASPGQLIPTEKLVTDRIRRLPRLRGWNALTVPFTGDTKFLRSMLLLWRTLCNQLRQKHDDLNRPSPVSVTQHPFSRSIRVLLLL